MEDALGKRMKENYEDRTRFFLPRRTYTIIRVDGKAFHTLTRGFHKPFDKELMEIMDKTAIAMCEQIQGVAFAYVQSDEISLLLTDFAKIATNAWFDGNIQKMASISAAIATAEFNSLLRQYATATAHNDYEMASKFLTGNPGTLKTAYFDSRVFSVPDPVEIQNYFIWRQNDSSRNSIQMAARAVYSHKECDNKNTTQLQDMMHEKGINWNDYTTGEKRGRIIKKESYYVNLRRSQIGLEDVKVERSRWISMDGNGCSNKYEIPIFTQDRGFLKNLIPEMHPKSEF